MADSAKSKATKRAVLQLLKEYAAWHAAFGGAASIDETANMAQASYGPAGYIEEGMYYFDYPKTYLIALAKSYEELEKAINKVKRSHNPKGMRAWLMLQDVYFGDPADWRIAERWRTVGDYRIQIHDVFVGWLVEELKNTELHPIWPKPYSEKEEKQIERQNAEIYATYQRIRTSGSAHDASVAQTAAIYSLEKQTDLSADAVERIIEFRYTLKPLRCVEPGCHKPIYQQNLCTKHYARQYRARNKPKRPSKKQT